MATELRLVIVTPEQTLIDQEVDSISLPMYDGGMGILPGRAPIVGRLGAGALRYRSGGTEYSVFVDGGFLQIKGPVASVLTNRSMQLDEIDAEAAAEQLSDALTRKVTTEDEFAVRDQEIDRARKMVALAKKPR